MKSASGMAQTPNSDEKRISAEQDEQSSDDNEKNLSFPTPDPRTTVTASPVPLPTPMPPLQPLPLLICSLGNPGATYANTLHSAGHTVLNLIASHLAYPPFRRERTLGNGLVSKPLTPLDRNWTLWQSTSYMNDSGKGVASAYRTWVKSLPDGEGRLVIVHDELEKPLGAVSVKSAQGLSARGHNGLKSVLGVLGKTPFVRVGVGIGRPVSRESREVAGYVLKKMGPAEMAEMEGCVVEVVARLEGLSYG